jgi:hypothetical protein
MTPLSRFQAFHHIIMTGNRLGTEGIGVRYPTGVRDFYILLSVQTSSGVHKAFCTMDTGLSFPGDKAAGTCS